jgi:hypothetical protein
MINLTGAIALIGFLQLIAFSLQARRLRQTVDTMQDTAVRQLRAYVHVEDVRAVFAGTLATYSVHIKNSGLTPAYGAVLKYRIELADFPLIAPLKVEADGSMVSKPIVPPGGFIHDTYTPPRSLNETQRKRIRDGNAAIYLHGTIAYEDAFKTKRITAFRFLCGGGVGLHPEGAMAACDQGNEAT